MSEENITIDSDQNHNSTTDNALTNKKEQSKLLKRSHGKCLVGLLIILVCIAFVYRNRVYVIDYLDIEYLINSYKNENKPAIFANDKIAEELVNDSRKGSSENSGKELASEEESIKEENKILQEDSPAKMSYMNDNVDVVGDNEKQEEPTITEPTIEISSQSDIPDENKVDNEIAEQSTDLAIDIDEINSEESRQVHDQDNFMLIPEPPLVIIQEVSLRQEDEEGSEIITILSDDVVLDEVDQYETYDETEQVVDSISDSFSKLELYAKAAKYRVYLKNASTLIEKFRTGKTYTEELEVLKIPFAKKQISIKGLDNQYNDINKFVERLEEYNKLLLNSKGSQYEEVNLGGKLLSNFIKVKKENIDYKAVLDIRYKIEQQIQLFNEFLYSQQLQDLFLLNQAY